MVVKVILDMPEGEYHKLDRLSASGIKLLHAGPLEYWYNTYGDGRQEESTPAQVSGSAKHSGILEGAEQFQKAYLPALCLEDYPGALDSQDDLKRWCKDHGLKVGGSKAVLSERIREACEASEETCPILWSELQLKYQSEADKSDRQILKQKVYSEVKAKAAMTAPIIDPLREAGGYPEATILWEESGIPCKARLDIFSPGIIIDLKNIENKYRRPFKEQCEIKIANELMNVQAAWYLRAARVAKEAGVLPFDYDGDFTFRWLFLQSEGCPNMDTRDYQTEKRSIDTGKYGMSMAHEKARGIISDGMAVYQQYQKTHGKTTEWRPKLTNKVMEDEDYPGWFLLRSDW